MRLLAVRLQNLNSLNSLNSLSEAHEVRLDEGALSAAGGAHHGADGCEEIDVAGCDAPSRRLGRNEPVVKPPDLPRPACHRTLRVRTAFLSDVILMIEPEFKPGHEAIICSVGPEIWSQGTRHQPFCRMRSHSRSFMRTWVMNSRLFSAAEGSSEAPTDSSMSSLKPLEPRGVLAVPP